MTTEGQHVGPADEWRQPPRKAHRDIRPGHTVAHIRGVLAELVVMSTAVDPFLSLKALASYSGMSVRKLREHLEDVARPLPHYRVGGKILVRRSEFDQWMHQFRRRGNADVERVVNEVLRDIERA